MSPSDIRFTRSAMNIIVVHPAEWISWREVCSLPVDETFNYITREEVKTIPFIENDDIEALHCFKISRNMVNKILCLVIKIVRKTKFMESGKLKIHI